MNKTQKKLLDIHKIIVELIVPKNSTEDNPLDYKKLRGVNDDSIQYCLESLEFRLYDYFKTLNK